jgi:geranylgeranyl diphosphate synthase type I
MSLQINDFKAEFDLFFNEQLNNLLLQAKERRGLQSIEKYIDHIKTIGHSGKRIRPYNTALTYTIYSGKDWHDIKNTLMGIELIHLMALIHDDIMDDSETRHGVVSAHKFIEQDLDPKVSTGIAKHTSQSLAILLGDIVFAWAYKEFSSDDQTKESWSVINTLVEEVILGQMMDVYNPIEKSTTMKAVENKMLLKTARYTFTHPLLLGAVLAQTDKNQISWIKDFGDAVGLLFQMQDDVFDFTKDVATLKKNPLGDIKNGVHTMLSVYINENANDEDKEKWSAWFGNKDTNNQDELNLFLKSTGAFDFAEEYIKQKESIALEAISNSNLKNEDSEKIKSLLSIVTNRKY